MGHDINAYGKDKKKISYLGLGALNPFCSEFYKALKCEDFFAEWSGCGERTFTREEIIAAKTTLLIRAQELTGSEDSRSNMRREIYFLDECLESGEETIEIVFQ